MVAEALLKLLVGVAETATLCASLIFEEVAVLTVLEEVNGDELLELAVELDPLVELLWLLEWLEDELEELLLELFAATLVEEALVGATHWY